MDGTAFDALDKISFPKKNNRCLLLASLASSAAMAQAANPSHDGGALGAPLRCFPAHPAAFESATLAAVLLSVDWALLTRSTKLLLLLTFSAESPEGIVEGEVGVEGIDGIEGTRRMMIAGFLEKV